ncbi:MAG: hypothetical protein V4555_16605 [Acidobacteriota bacterium]
MAPEEWYTPAAESAPVEAVAPVARPAAFDLRPLTLGEILDRTFAVYRSRFWMFVGIASLSAAVQLLMGAVQVMVQHRMGPMDPSHPSPLIVTRSMELILVSLGLSVFTFLAFSLTQAATVFALSEVYLGRTTTIGTSLRSAFSHWLRYIGIAIWQLWSAMWVGLVLIIPAIMLTATGVTGLAVLGGLLAAVAMLGGVVVGVVLYLRNSLAVPASVVEGLPVAASMRRSKQLAVGTKGRIFVVLLISLVLYIVVGMVESPLALLIMAAAVQHKEAVGAQAATLLINFMGYAVVGPVAMIGLSLVYFDQRVRLEAFDLMVLLGEEQPSLPVAESAVAIAPAFAATEVPAPEVTAAPADDTVVAESETTAATETITEDDAGRPDDATGL